MFLKIVRGQPGLHSETLFHKIVTIKSDKNLEALTFHSSPAPKDEELVATRPHPQHILRRVRSREKLFAGEQSTPGSSGFEPSHHRKLRPEACILF
jgi:hypothetical protein